MDCAPPALALRCAAGCSGRSAACTSSSPAARFEPPEGYKPSTVFKTAAFDRSATSPLTCRYMAEREGFEPSVRGKPYTRFPGEPVRPLRHLSINLSSNPQLQPRPDGRPGSGREREGWTARLCRLPSASLRVVPAASRPAHRARLRLGSNPRYADCHNQRVHSLSRRARSTTPAPLRLLAQQHILACAKPSIVPRQPRCSTDG